MLNSPPTVLQRGRPYPFAAPREGATANFLQANGNLLLIGLPEIVHSEEKAVRLEPMRAGLIHDGPFILWIFTFGTMIFECPFDARLIPRDQLCLPRGITPNTRLGVDVHLVDSATRILRGIRFVTISPSLTGKFLEAVQEQSRDQRATSPIEDRYCNMPLDHLSALSELERCGS